jgi:AraC-like DNA-binding protein
MMKYLTIPPDETLKDFVSHFWISEFEGGCNETYNYLSTADSCCKIVFIYQKTEGDRPNLMSSGIQGQTELHGVFPTFGNFEIFGINLFPQSVRYLLSLPAADLSNQLLDFDSLLGQKGRDLNDKMSKAITLFERRSVIEDFFQRQLIGNYVRQPNIVEAIKYIRLKRGLVDVGEMHEEFCLSQKQFERKFKEWTGFMPKLYSRILRFESILCDYNGTKSLTEMSYQYGYYDQSHFIKEFKAFSGYTPSQYFAIVNQ